MDKYKKNLYFILFLIMLIFCFGTFTRVNTPLITQENGNFSSLSDKNRTQSPAKAGTISLLFFGDAIPHESMRKINLNYSYKTIIHHLYYSLRKQIKNSLVFYNLETTIMDSAQPALSLRFSETRQLPVLLASLGWKFMTIANNHILDFGKTGFDQTLENLSSISDANWCGISKIEGNSLFLKTMIIEKNGLKIGFCSSTLLMNAFSTYESLPNESTKPAFFRELTPEILKQIHDFSLQTDLLIFGIHWGDEYRETPSQFQQNLGKKLIDNGVDIVWGHHPHIMQPLEVYKKKLIIYSNGNFFSGQALNYTDPLNDKIHKNYYYTRGIPVFKIVFKKNELDSISLYPFFQANNYRQYKKNGFYVSTLIPLLSGENEVSITRNDFSCNISDPFSGFLYENVYPFYSVENKNYIKQFLLKQFYLISSDKDSVKYSIIPVKYGLKIKF